MPLDQVLLPSPGIIDELERCALLAVAKQGDEGDDIEVGKETEDLAVEAADLSEQEGDEAHGGRGGDLDDAVEQHGEALAASHALAI